MASKKMLELKRTEPAPLHAVKVRVGKSFPVRARILADNIARCEVFLRFDEIVFDEISRQPNPVSFTGPFVDEEIGWRLQGKKAAAQTFVTIDAFGNGLPQKSEFAVEVTR